MSQMVVEREGSGARVIRLAAAAQHFGACILIEPISLDSDRGVKPRAYRQGLPSRSKYS